MPVIINGSTGISGTDGSAGTPAVQGTDTNTGMFFPAADQIAFAEGGVEAMRLDASGNVGIGTTTPTQRLTVNTAGNYNLFFSTAADTGLSLAANNRVQGTSDFIFIQQGSGDGYLWNRANNPILFGTNNTERARITSGGDFQFNSGYGSVATAFGCRAWVTFSVPGGTPTILASGGVSSLTDVATGDIGINLTNAMPDANYAVVTGPAGVRNSNNRFSSQYSNKTTTGITVVFVNEVFSNSDPTNPASVAFFR